MTNELTSSAALWATAIMAAISMLKAWTARFNQFFFFSRTVWDGFRQTAEAKQIELNYRMRVWLALVPACLVFSLLVTEAHRPVLTSLLVSMLMQAGICKASFAMAHRATGEILARIAHLEGGAQARGGD